MSVLRQRGQLAAGALAAVVLGTTSTAALAGLVAEQESAGSVSPQVSECQVPALPGTVVDVDLSDMGSMMGTGSPGEASQTCGPGTGEPMGVVPAPWAGRL